MSASDALSSDVPESAWPVPGRGGGQAAQSGRAPGAGCTAVVSSPVASAVSGVGPSASGVATASGSGSGAGAGGAGRG